LEIARKRSVRSQGELSFLLRQEGVNVTQSTLSRDIRELGLVKARGCYQASGELHSALPDEMLRRAFEQFVVRTGVSGNIVMIRTSPGNAHSIGVVLDAAQWPEILGTVAGDDTVFVLLRNGHFGKKVLGRIRELSE
jgi:transcriptional regulator of arginine metabolism